MADPFADSLRRPAVENIPGGALRRVIVNSRYPQLRPKFHQRAVKRGKGKVSGQLLAQPGLRERSFTPYDLERVAGKLGIFGTRTAFGRLLGVAVTHQGVKIRKNRSRYQKIIVFLEQVRFV